MTVAIEYVQNDLPDSFKLQSKEVAIDCEMTGLSLTNDRLCTIQLWDGVGSVWIVQFSNDFTASRLKKLLSDKKVEKVFHYGRKDLSFIEKFLTPVCGIIFDTKIAYRILNPTDTIKASLKELTEKYTGVLLAKTSQLSDWTQHPLTSEQLTYAAEDVLYLFAIKEKQTQELLEKGRLDWMKHACAFLPILTKIDQTTGDENNRLFQYT